MGLNPGISLLGEHRQKVFEDIVTSLLTTNRRYDQNFLKKMSIQTTIKMSLKFQIEPHFEM